MENFKESSRRQIVARPTQRVCLPASAPRFTTSRQAVDIIVQIYSPLGVCDWSHAITPTHLVSRTLEKTECSLFPCSEVSWERILQRVETSPWSSCKAPPTPLSHFTESNPCRLECHRSGSPVESPRFSAKYVKYLARFKGDVELHLNLARRLMAHLPAGGMRSGTWCFICKRHVLWDAFPAPQLQKTAAA